MNLKPVLQVGWFFPPQGWWKGPPQQPAHVCARVTYADQVPALWAWRHRQLWNLPALKLCLWAGLQRGALEREVIMGLGKSKCPEEVSNDPPVVWLFPAASSPYKKREKGGMWPQLVNSPLALHTDEQHRILHAHLVNILKSSLMKNQSSIINRSLSDLIRDNLGVPFCLNPCVVL